MTQFLDTHVDKSLTSTDTWLDIDLSGDIPVSATGAIFRVVSSVSAVKKFGLRKKGSTDDRYGNIWYPAHESYIIGVDSNRKCQGKIEDLGIDFILVGYTDVDATMLTNGVDKSLNITASWQDIDLSGELPAGAVAAIFEVQNTFGTDYSFGLRKNGSTDNRYIDITGNSNLCFIVGVDGNRKCEGKIEFNVIDFYLIGYLTMGAANTNAVDKSLGSTGSYIDITESEAPAGATGAFVEVNVSTIGWTSAARKNGASDDIYHRSPSKHFQLCTGLDSNKKWEGKIENTIIDFFTLGYFVGEHRTKESSAGITIKESGVTTFFDTPINKSLGNTGAWTDIDLSGDIPANASGVVIRVENTADSWKRFGLRKKGSTDDRFGEAEAHDQGYHIIGVDSNRKIQGKIESTYVDFKLIGYTAGDIVLFTNGIDKSLSVWDTWTDIDLSGEIPVGAVAAIFEAHNVLTQPNSWSLRKKGSTDDRFEDICEARCDTYTVGVDTNRICQGKIESTGIDFYLMGYLIEGSMETNGIDRSLTETGSYIEVTESSAPEGTPGVILDYRAVQMTTKYAARKKGSSEDTYLRPEARKSMIYVPIDADKKWEGKIEDLGNDWFTVGYFAPTTGAKTKESSAGLSISDTVTKESSAGICIVARNTKESSAGVRIVARNTKESSAGVRIVARNTKESSASLSVSAEGERISSGGIRIVTRFTKESSAGLSIYGGAMLESSGGLAISEKKTKESSAGILISESKTKASSAGIRIINQTLKESSASLTVKASYTKASSAGISIVSPQLKQSSASLTVSGKNTLVSSGGLTIFEAVLKKGLFYGKLGDVILETVMPESFRISEEINRIPTFEFEVANSEANRTAIAANITALFKIYWQHHGLDTHIFTGIINADGIEYVSLSNIRITGFASYAKLGWPLYKHLDAGDAEPVNKVFEYNGTYTDYTTAANNATINDITVSFADVNHCLYIGEANPFWGLQVKYSTKGVPAGAVIVIEFSKGVGMWETLDVLDETNAFTEDPGTYDIIIPHPPSDWARNTVNGISKFWIRWRIVSGAYTTAPKIDQIHTVNVDVYRVFYYETSARQILLDVLEDTEYSMDAIDTCPEDEINLLAEYESPLRVIAAIPAALTWTDTDGSKKSYQWWIDEAKKVHMKQKRGTTYSDDITGDLTIFNNLVDYFNISNRLFGFSKRDGLSQIRAIIEDKQSQTTHTLREIVVPKNEIGKYLTLKASLEKDITYSKDPMQRIKGSVSTEFWGLRNYEVGDTITLHQGEWVVDEGEFQIVKADIGPLLTQLNLGISREHLDGLKSNMKRAFDISNVQMHGSTSLLTAGPETANYERKSDGSVFSAKLKIEIPSEVIKTHKVLLSWTIGPYRASVNEQTGEGVGHDHNGFAGDGGAIDSDWVGEGGAFTPEILDDGDFTPEMLSEAHKHGIEGTLSMELTKHALFPLLDHEIKGTTHRHTKGRTGLPDDVANAVVGLQMGCECSEACGGGNCVVDVIGEGFAEASHWHLNTDLYSGWTELNAWVYCGNAIDVVKDVDFSDIQFWTSKDEAPAHLHDGVYEPDHGHTGVAELGHSDHIIPAVLAHNDHLIAIEPAEPLDIEYGIHEEAAGTILELLVNSEKIGEFSGPQTGVRIDGYLTSSTNTIEIRPVSSELSKKGSVAIAANGILFIEPRRF